MQRNRNQGVVGRRGGRDDEVIVAVGWDAGSKSQQQKRRGRNGTSPWVVGPPFFTWIDGWKPSVEPAKMNLEARDEEG